MRKLMSIGTLGNWLGIVLVGYSFAVSPVCLSARQANSEIDANSARSNVLLPKFPSPEPLREAVLFAFDDLAFPIRKDVHIDLIEGQHPRRVVPAGPEGSHDESWGYFTIIRIDDVFHLWVITYSFAHETQSLCYARSGDGIHWEKPALGLVEFNGSKDNNIIESPFPLRSPTCKDVLTDFVVRFDPDDPRPDRHYKMAMNLITEQEHHLCIAYSADGLRWKPGPMKRQFFEMGGITRFKDLYYMTGQASIPRRLDVFSSSDFDHWTHLGVGFARDHLPPLEKETPSHLPDPEKWAPAGIGKGEQVHCGAGLWNRGNVILGIYDAWHGREQDRRLITIDLGLVVSHDCIHFTEPMQSFPLVSARKQPALPQEFGPALTHGQAIDNIGDQTCCWYTWWHPPEHERGTYVVTWDRDRLGLAAANSPAGATIISTPVKITAGQASVYVNASGLDQHNRLRISLLDERGQPVPGFSGDESTILTNDGLRIPVLWQGKKLSSSLGTVSIQVEFDGMSSRLHAIYIAH